MTVSLGCHIREVSNFQRMTIFQQLLVNIYILGGFHDDETANFHQRKCDQNVLNLNFPCVMTGVRKWKHITTCNKILQ